MYVTCVQKFGCTIYNYLSCRYSKLLLFKKLLDMQMIIDVQFERLALTSYITLAFERGDPASTSSNLGNE